MSVESTVLITGATGLVGQGVVGKLKQLAWPYRAVGRHASADVRGVGNIDGKTCWTPHLRGVGAVVHTAARVHQMREAAIDPLAEFRSVNVDGTLRLAREASEAGVRRFVFLSSIKVNGERTLPGRPFTAEDSPAPEGAYGLSKHEAEKGLCALAAETGMEIVTIRPVLIYGPGVKANFLSMMRWLARGMPLPLGGIHNQRSLVGIDNLVDLIMACMWHPAAANQTFLVSDGEDVSTPELLQRLSAALGRPARLIPVPPRLLKAAAALVGQRAAAERLCESLQVDNGKTQELLGWTPPVSVDEGLARTAAYFLRSERC